jgi:dihydrofolate synthase/folylpolyglutamate synthase
MQRVQLPDGRTVLLDAAHNPAGAEALRVALSEGSFQRRAVMIIGVFRDKDSASMCRSLAPLASRIILTPVHSERTEDPSRLLPACREANPDVSVEVCGSLAEALRLTEREPFVVVAGSLYLVGEAMELLHLSASGSTDEKPLNEWHNPKKP